MTFSANRKRFTHPQAWSGVGSHGLSLRYSGTSTARLQAARDAVWTFPGLEGCWTRRDREPSLASRATCTWGLKLRKELFGIAHLPGTDGIACRAVVHEPTFAQDEDCPLCKALGYHHEEPAGWLSFHLPFGGLGMAFPIGGYPCSDGSSLAWRDEVDAWLRALAEHVHRAAPFDLALVGWTDCQFGPLPLRAEDVWEERTVGYLFPRPGGLVWFPPTMGAPIDLEDE
jgi:hypothetical protein